MAMRLQQKVWAMDRCSGCGACVSACSKGMLRWNGDQEPILEQREKALGLTRLRLRACEVCGKFCELSCPRLTDMAPHPSLNSVSVRTTTITHSGDPNEIIKSILVGARSAERIDGVILLDLDPWTLKPMARIATSIHDIVGGIGMQYLWAPVLDKLNEAIFDRGLENLAVVGPPCVAEGARRLKETNNPRLWPYQQAIRLTISRFCTGVYMPEIIPELIERRVGLSRQEIRELTTSIPDGTLRVTTWDDEQRTIQLTELEKYTRHGCGCCTDYLGESADIVVGRLGALPDHATLITRTPVGEFIYKNALHLNLLEFQDQIDEEVLHSAKTEKDRRSRAKEFDELHILLLDTLGDPKKQAHVRKCFVKLFGAPQGANKARRKVDVSCGGCS